MTARLGANTNVQVRKATIVKDDGVEISRTYHRHVLHCRTKTGDTWGDTDISGEDATVQAVCNAVWTSDVKSAYETFIDNQEDTLMTRPRDIADSINRINSSAADATAVTIDSSENVGIGRLRQHH